MRPEMTRRVTRAGSHHRDLILSGPLAVVALHRQVDDELGPAADLRVDDDLAAVLADDLLGDRETQASPSGALGRGEDLEDRAELILGDADAVVGDGDAGGRGWVVPGGRDDDSGARLVLGGVDGVGDDVQDRTVN